MKKTTKHLARQVQQALLALPDTILLETIEQWLKDFDKLFEESDILDGFYEIFGYKVWSEATRLQYASLDELFEAEPEAEKISWLPPAMQDLREALQMMQPEHIYHGVVALAGEVFRQKLCAASFGEPPATDRSDGYAFMRNLSGYLDLRKEGKELSTEQFEARYAEQIEALAASNAADEEDVFESFPDMFTNERVVHFRIVFSQGDQQQYRDLLQALQQYDFLLSPSQEANTIEGCVSYIPQRRDDLKMLARVRRLLNRWQRSGQITLTERKEKSPKRPSHKKRKQKVRRRR